MERRKEKRKKRRKGIFKNKSLYAIIFAIAILSIAFIHSTQHSPTNQTFQLKAAIVDHLSLTAPNPTFIQTATNILKQAGYTVDYYPGETVTVEFYRNLPTHGYGLIILRGHTALKKASEPPLCLFTSQPYSNEYWLEELLDRIVRVSFIANEPPYYFGILPKFIRDSMNGKFSNTIIIMMGCNGLTYTYMAQAFIGKGAKAYIGWSESVSASRTDQATIQLLKHLITEKQTIKQAVTETMNEVEPDPQYESILLYHPDSVDNYIIPNITSNLILKDATISSHDSKSSLHH